MGDESYTEAMEKLFSASWNVPRAAKHYGVTDAECKEMFASYCKENPMTHVEFNGVKSID